MSAGDGKSSLSNDEVVEFTFEFAVFVSAVRLSYNEAKFLDPDMDCVWSHAIISLERISDVVDGSRPRSAPSYSCEASSVPTSKSIRERMFDQESSSGFNGDSDDLISVEASHEGFVKVD